MTRLQRKNLTNKDLGIKDSGGINDLFDNELKLSFRYTDEMYDNLAENISNEELNFLFEERLRTFTEKRRILSIINRFANDIRNNTTDNI